MEGSRWLRSAVSALLVLGALTAVPSMAGAATAPRVTNVNPGSGPQAGGNIVTITGSGFTRSSTVTFGAVNAATMHFVSSTTLYAKAPKHTGALVHIHVRTAAGTSANLDANRYAFTPGPHPLPQGEVRTVFSSGVITSLSCPSASFCAVVNDHGGASIFKGSSWSPEEQIDGSARLTAVSCPSASACVAVDAVGRAVRYNGKTWGTRARIDAFRQLTSVSCPSGGFCMAVDSAGYNVAYSNGHWHTPHQTGAHAFADISCPSSAFCFAVGSHVVRYTGTWHKPHGFGYESLDAVSCTWAKFCMVGFEDSYLGTIGTRTYTGVSLSRPTNLYGLEGRVTDLSCMSARYCLVPNSYDGGQYIDFLDGAANGGSIFLSGVLHYDPYPDVVSCWAARECMAAEDFGAVRLG